MIWCFYRHHLWIKNSQLLEGEDKSDFYLSLGDKGNVQRVRKELSVIVSPVHIITYSKTKKGRRT